MLIVIDSLTVSTVAKVTVPPSSVSSHGSRTDMAPRLMAAYKEIKTELQQVQTELEYIALL